MRDGGYPAYDDYFYMVGPLRVRMTSHSGTLELLGQLVDGCKTLIIYILVPGLLNTYIH